MKREGQALRVRCIFPEKGEPQQKLIVQSLRLFVRRNFPGNGGPDGMAGRRCPAGRRGDGGLYRGPRCPG